MAWGVSSPAWRPPGYVPPCLPTLARAVPDGPGWVHEIKHDGFRFIVRRDGDQIRVFTRRGYEWTDRAPGIVEAARSLRAKSVILDGEAVVCGPNGVTDFARLRSALARGSGEAFLYAFDILELNGTDLRSWPWEARRKTLERRVLWKVPRGIRISEHIESGYGQAMFEAACTMGLEGIVSKRRDSPYRSGRSPDWVKVKNPNAPAATRLLE
jgi:bifunctional non-homologous end joining protein LigD